jgi:hypothetical protein
VPEEDIQVVAEAAGVERAPALAAHCIGKENGGGGVGGVRVGGLFGFPRPEGREFLRRDDRWRRGGVLQEELGDVPGGGFGALGGL